MQWWGWLIVVVVVIVALVGAVLAVQARRRRSGVIVRAGRVGLGTRWVVSRLMRTSEIAKRPVVTLDGEDVGQIKDVVYSAGGRGGRRFHPRRARAVRRAAQAGPALARCWR